MAACWQKSLFLSPAGFQISSLDLWRFGGKAVAGVQAQPPASPEEGQQVGDTLGVMPRAKLASLVPDPDFWVYFEGLCGGVRHLKDSFALLPWCWLYPPSCCSSLARAIPSLTGWLGRSRSVHRLEKLWHGGDDCTVTLETAVCFVGSCF